MMTFKDSGINPLLRKALKEIGFENMTPIQERAIPYLLQSEEDLVALAQTGTGKTAAFSLPIIEKINIKKNIPQGLVLCPTRELALQIEKDFIRFSKYFNLKITSIYGGASIETQIKNLKDGAQIIIATPGRLVDIIRRKKINLSAINYLVLDEADEMLNMGFKEELDKIIKALPSSRQTLLFSATMPREIEHIASFYLKNPKEITISKNNLEESTITHTYCLVNKSDKYAVLKRIIDHNPSIYGIVFCKTKAETKEISDKFSRLGYKVDGLSGDLSQGQRESIMKRFRSKSLELLIATDVAARGIDVSNLTHVIHYHLPDEEIYIHRSGRTGRAGNKGISIALLEGRDLRKLKSLEVKTKARFEKLEIPKGDEICENQLGYFIEKFKELKVEKDSIKESLLKKVVKEFESLDRETLIKKIIFKELNTLFSYYRKNKEIIFNPKEKGSLTRKSDKYDRFSKNRRSESRFATNATNARNNSSFSKLSLSIGANHSMTKLALIGLINKATKSRNIDIGKIQISKNSSSFEIESSVREKVLKALKSTTYQGTFFSCK